jgi:hypothetical protein
LTPSVIPTRAYRRATKCKGGALEHDASRWNHLDASCPVNKQRRASLRSRIAAASAALAGHIEEAKRFAKLLLEMDPGRRMSNLDNVLGPYRRLEDVDRYKEGLRLAGLPE